ncbi:MAG: bifunctional 2-methylcitrate synthase/citrate synthase [Phycisphaerales bacterium]|nr:bifunctional 2-methylcitrate synthase/citrate synthase [Phycisphaerales bacterium]
MTDAIYKPGLEGVIAGETAVAEVDQTTLRYRGYAIGELAEKTSFEEVAHLLLYGDLPKSAQLNQFKTALTQLRPLPTQLVQTLRLIPADVPMMDVLRTAVSLAGHFDPVTGDSPDDLRRRAVWLTALVAGVVAVRFRLLNRKEPLEPKPGLSHAAQLLYQSLGEDPDPTAARLLDLTLTLYAEHEYNASTFATRIVASTLSDMVSGVVTGIGTLKGPLHGGANEASMAMLKQFDSPEQARKWVYESFEKKRKIMGFGHRVYKNGDHRAHLLEAELRKLAAQKGQQKWMDIYDAVKEPMVKEKGIHPNVDYPCGLTYFLLGLPIDMYTPLFVCSRVTGWCAHFIEQFTNNRLIRPLSRYTGPAPRAVKPISQR